MADQLIEVGHTRKTHGSQGELKVEVKDAFLDDFVEADVVFLTVQGKPLPHFVEHLRETADLLLKLEGINSPDQAKHLTNQPIFLRKIDIRHADPNQSLDFHQLVGFLLLDASKGGIGPIREVLDMPMQLVAVAEHQGREVLVPLHPDMVADLDEEKKMLTLRLPDGLLDL